MVQLWDCSCLPRAVAGFLAGVKASHHSSDTESHDRLDLGVSICICICICFTGLPLEWVFVFVFMSFGWSWSEYLYFELVIASLVGKHLSFVLRKYSCKDYRAPTELYAPGAWIYAAIQHSRVGCLGGSAQSGDASEGGWSSPCGSCHRRSNWLEAAVYRLSCCHQSGWVPML